MNSRPKFHSAVEREEYERLRPDTDCIVCLSVGAHGPQAATLSAIAAVVGLGIGQVCRDLCVRHESLVNAAVKHASADR